MRIRTALLRSGAFLKHDTGEHPERAARIAAIERELDRRDLIAGRPDISFGPASDEHILRIHSARHLARLAAIASAGGGWIDADTVVRPESLDVARLAAGAAIAAIEALLGDRIDRAFVIARPPGHHATPDRAMGFCLLNTAAIAAAHAAASGVHRISILDWDVHHGNGTQDAFYGRSDVHYCSLHQWPHYPGTGDSDETGMGDGKGFTLNVPLQAGTGDAGYFHALQTMAVPAIDAFGPELVVVSAGYDAHANDPLASMRVSDRGFEAITEASIKLANRHGGKLLMVLEGGYHPPSLASGVANSIALLDRVPFAERE